MASQWLGSAATPVLDGFHASLYVDDTYSFPFDGTIAHRIADALLLAGFVLLALVRRGGQRMTAGGFGARVSLVAFAAFRPVNAIVLAATIDDPQTRSWAAIALRLVLLLMGAHAAVSIMRAAVIDRWTRRLLVMAVGAQVLLSVLVTTPSLVLLQLGASLWLLRPLSLAALGIGLLVDGRHARIRRRVEAIRAGWRPRDRPTAVPGELHGTQHCALRGQYRLVELSLGSSRRRFSR